MSDELIRVTGLGRDYGTGERAVHAVRDVSFTAGKGELVAVRGRSGAGKTTLLNMIGGLDRPTRGSVEVAGHDVTAAGEAELLELRRTTIGFVFQSFGLIPILSAAENVSVPLRLTRRPAAERTERVALLLELVGLGGQAAQRPGELSGGPLTGRATQRRKTVIRSNPGNVPLRMSQAGGGRGDEDFRAVAGRPPAREEARNARHQPRRPASRRSCRRPG